MEAEEKWGGRRWEAEEKRDGDGVVYREKKKGGRRWVGEEEDGSGREKELKLKIKLLFYNKNNNILIKLTRLFSFRGGDALVYYCLLESITVHLGG